MAPRPVFPTRLSTSWQLGATQGAPQAAAAGNGSQGNNGAPPPPPPSAANEATNHLSAGFGGYGSPRAAAAAGPHFRGYWGNGQAAAVADSGALHMVPTVQVDPNVAPPPPQLPEPFRGPTTSPFSQPKYQGNKNSFGLATGPPLQQQQGPTVSAAVTTAAVTNGGGSDHGGQVAVAVSAGNAEAGSGNQVDQVELEVNESIIGAVIGPQGECIVDIQQFSGARIQISKKGQYSPGTRNRLVTVVGSPKSISAAKYLIEKKIVEEEGKRERQAAAAAAAASAAQPAAASHTASPPSSSVAAVITSNGGASPAASAAAAAAAAANYWDCIIRNEIILEA